MIYLDSNATTQVHPEVLEAMMPFLTDQWYNPSSGYRAAKVVKNALELAHEQVAALVNAKPEEIVMTGCGTESNNAVLAFAASQGGDKKRFITSEIEHSAVLRYSESLTDTSAIEVEKIGVDSSGRLQLDDFEKSLEKGGSILASIMWANNETGVIQPITEAAALARKHGVAFHTDAIQAVGKTPVDVRSSGIDFLSISGHKYHAPKGVGCLLYTSPSPRDQRGSRMPSSA